MRPYGGALALALACMALYAAMNFASLGMISPLMSVLFERSGSNLDRHYDPVTFTADPAWRGRFLGSLRPGRFRLTVRRGEVPDRLFLYRAGKLGTGASMSVRTAVFHELGGFDELLGAGAPVPGGEDHLLLVRLAVIRAQVDLRPPDPGGVRVRPALRPRSGPLRRPVSARGAGNRPCSEPISDPVW